VSKAWIVVALVVTLGITLGGVGTALAMSDSAPELAPPLEGQSLCWIAGEVTAVGENSITVEGVKVKRVVEDGSASFERIKGTFTVTVNDDTQYCCQDKNCFENQNRLEYQNRFENKSGFGNQNSFGNHYGSWNQNRFENQYLVSADGGLSLEDIHEGDRVSVVAEELEDGSLLAKRVVVIPEGVKVMRLRHALLIMDREREMMALAIPRMQFAILAKPIKIVPFSELPFELPSLLEPE
jgi:hypothetical protein